MKTRKRKMEHWESNKERFLKFLNLVSECAFQNKYPKSNMFGYDLACILDHQPETGAKTGQQP